MKLFLALMVSVLVGCVSDVGLPAEYVQCSHKYDNSRNIRTASFSDIEHIAVSQCPQVLWDENGECPVMVKLISLDDNIHWLTEDEFENYTCILKGD